MSWPAAFPFGSGVSDTFTRCDLRHFSRFPLCLRTLVSIGRRGCPFVPCVWGSFRRYPQASHPWQCHCQTHAAYPSHHYSLVAFFRQLLHSLEGAQKRIAPDLIALMPPYLPG